MPTIIVHALDGSRGAFKDAQLKIDDGVAIIKQAEKWTYLPMSGVLTIEHIPAPIGAPTIPTVPRSNKDRFWHI